MSDHFLEKVTLAAILEFRKILKNCDFFKNSPISETIRDRAKRMKIWNPWGILHLVNISDYFLEKVTLAAILEFRKIFEKLWFFKNFTLVLMFQWNYNFGIIIFKITKLIKNT